MSDAVPVFPTIGMVTWHNCVRVTKEATVLKAAGYPVRLVTNRINYGVESYDTVSYYNSNDQLDRAIRLQPDVDIWHVHNEPDAIAERVQIAKAPHQRMIWDLHDFESARWSSSPFLEQKVLRAADGIVHVSDPMAALAQEIYGAGHPPWVALGCHVPAAWQVPPRPSEEQWGDLVYEGGLDRPYKPLQHTHRGPEVSFRDYGLLFEAAVSAGFSVTAYGSNVMEAGCADGYAAIGAWVRGQLDYPDLMPTLSRYRWGLVGSTTPSLLMDRALPNKLFEYLAAGIPVVVVHASAAADLVRHLGVGVVLSSVTEGEPKAQILARWRTELQAHCTPATQAACRATVLAVRDAWTMDAQIAPLTALYAQVWKGGRRHATRRPRTAPRAPSARETRVGRLAHV